MRPHALRAVPRPAGRAAYPVGLPPPASLEVGDTDDEQHQIATVIYEVRPRDRDREALERRLRQIPPLPLQGDARASPRRTG